MCGICGFNWEDKTIIRRMTRAMAHRGPDGSGHYTDNGVSLGHRRLSIIDLTERGKQPMCNEEGALWITYNGEVYNHLEIRAGLESRGHRFKSSTDTEVIIHAFEEYGPKCLEMLNGMFAFALWNSEKNELFLARDRMGIKPLYYYHKKSTGEFIFASEIKAILEHDVERRVNPEALHDFLSFRCVSTEETMFKGIKRVLPAHSITVKGRNLKKNRYWRALEKDEDARADETKDDAHFIKEVRALLEQSVKMRLMSDVPIGAYLSGGIDSGSIVGLMSKLTSGPVKTFSVGFGYRDEHDELENARFLADHFRTDHHEIIVKADTAKILPKIVWHLDEPMSDPTCIPVSLLSEKIKKFATVVLTGDGGDEQFAGYEQYRFMMLHKRYAQKFPVMLRKFGARLLSLVPKPALNTAFPYASALGEKGLERFAEFISTNNPARKYLSMVAVFSEDEKKELYGKGLHEKTRSIDYINDFNKRHFNNRKQYLNNVIRLDIEKILAENMLMKTDKMTMAHSVEARVPLLDHRISELTAAMPSRMRMRGITDKYVLRKAMQGIIPKQTANRKKSRFFVPIDKWLSGELMDMAKQMLERERLKKEGFFEHKYVEKAFRGLKSSRLYYSRQLWSLLCFELWHEKFISQK